MKKLNNKLTKKKSRRAHDRPAPILKFTPRAWAKLVYLRDLGDSEVGGFGISGEDDPLLVTDVQLVQQSCTYASVAFDDESVADFFDNQVDQGLQPSQFCRLWLHTHPGDSAQPSMTDEETFDRVFGSPDWAVMFILAQEGETYARLCFNVGPRTSVEIPTRVDFNAPFEASDHDAWDHEYYQNVHVAQPHLLAQRGWPAGDLRALPVEQPEDWMDAWGDYVDGFENQPTHSGDLA